MEARGGIEPPIMVLQTMSTLVIASVYACIRVCYTHSIPNWWYTWVIGGSHAKRTHSAERAMVDIEGSRVGCERGRETACGFLQETARDSPQRRGTSTSRRTGFGESGTGEGQRWTRTRPVRRLCEVLP